MPWVHWCCLACVHSPFHPSEGGIGLSYSPPPLPFLNDNNTSLFLCPALLLSHLPIAIEFDRLCLPQKTTVFVKTFRSTARPSATRRIGTVHTARE